MPNKGTSLHAAAGAGFLDRLIERLGRLDPASVQAYILRLVRERGFLETVFNTINEGVIVIDHTRSIQYVNRAARRLLGMPEELGNLRIDRLLREVDWGRIMSADPAEWNHMSLQQIEVFYPEHRFLSFYLVPCRLPEAETAEIPLAVLILHDVTGLHADTQKTLESQKVQAITMLAAGVAHEIGNPLNSLNIHLQLLGRCLARDGGGDVRAEAAELLAVARQEVQRLDGIVSHFLRAVRPVPPELQVVNVQELLTEALQFMRAEFEDRSVFVDTVWPEHVPPVMGDPNQLKQAFFNLFRNALQAMPDGGLLRIACTEQEQFLEIRVADTGKGISREAFPHLLEPYFTTRAEGSGLGLMVVDRIIRAHGGELGIESREGAGAVFSVRLPLRDRRLRLLTEAAAGPPAESA
jgi:signal transduction histidine kinase